MVLNYNIAVLLTCHNRREKTLACLAALYNCNIPENFSFDVFLVDDGSTDGTGVAVKANYPKVKVIQGAGNLYWNRGMHLAWQMAAREKDYDFYLWLNDDTNLFQDALKNLISFSNKNENNAIIVAPTCSKKGSNVTYSGFDKAGKLIVPNQLQQEAETFNGNCVLVPLTAYQILGTLDPIFHHAIGDIDYGLRAKAKEIKIYVAPHFLAYCEGHETLPSWCLKETPFLERIKALYSPLGNSHPYYYFRFEVRHFGWLIAVKHLFSIHLRLLFPQLWK